jgi:hypothetical protein
MCAYDIPADANGGAYQRLHPHLDPILLQCHQHHCPFAIPSPVIRKGVGEREWGAGLPTHLLPQYSAYLQGTL